MKDIAKKLKLVNVLMNFTLFIGFNRILTVSKKYDSKDPPITQYDYDKRNAYLLPVFIRFNRILTVSKKYDSKDPTILHYAYGKRNAYLLPVFIRFNRILTVNQI